jgi:membrane glycosyltransferase
MTPPSLPAAPAAQTCSTAPPLHRGSMPARPWLGFVRALGHGLADVRAGVARGGTDEATRTWQAAGRRRRAALVVAVGVLTSIALALLPPAGPAVADGGTPALLAHGLQVALFTLLFAWVGVGFVTALMGAWVMLRGDRHALRPRRERSPIDAGARTAIVMPICNEDIATVFGGLRATCESLAATGALRLFDVYILSDTSDPALRAAELRAWAQLRETLGDGPVGAGGRVFYRWRRRRTKRKAGNVADFCRRWGRDYRYMVVLDADSTMHGGTLVELVRLMEANPRAGIVQTLPQAVGHDTLHARAQQFASRVTGRLFALGMAYWQLGDSHYWGHNAIIRVEPFMRHCGLAPIPGRGGLAGEILSHDFVEAAMMRRAGYEVWLAPQLDGSWEQPPANLLDELQRDRRWCQGNLQNARLIAEPGWQPVHRAMFAVGALSYAVAPLWLAFIVLGLLPWVGGSAAAPMAEAAQGLGVVWTLTLVLLLLPRLLGVGAVLLARRQRDFGGTARLLAGALLELGLSLLQAPVRMLAHTAFVLSALTGLKLDWKSPPRDARALHWGDVFRRIGLPALAAAGALAWTAKQTALTAAHMAPLLLAWLLAMPLAVWSSHVAFGAALRRRWLLAIPDETQPPRALLRAGEHADFARLQPPPAAMPARPAARPAPVRPAWGAGALALAGFDALRRGVGAWGIGRPALAAVAAATLVFALVPRPAATPELSAQFASQLEHYQMARRETLRLASVGATRMPAARVASPAPSLRTGPATSIGDDVRQRALEYVARGARPG